MLALVILAACDFPDDEFRTWMSENYDNIILDYVPGGCTGLHQPCDVGIQRTFKHSIKKSYHESLVNEMLKGIAEKRPNLMVDKTLKTVRDQSITWLWRAYNTVNNKELVKKAFEMCRVREWNLSYESLTSIEARERLRNLKTEDPQFWDELTKNNTAADIPKPDEHVPDDDFGEGDQDDYGDDSSITLSAVILTTMNGVGGGDAVTRNEGGGLVLKSLAEKEEEEPVGPIDGAADENQVAHTPVAEDAAEASTSARESGKGKRTRTANKWYPLKNFMRHDDGDDDGGESETASRRKQSGSKRLKLGK